MALSASREPLRQYGRLRTDDVDHARHVVSEVYEPHALEPARPGEFDARLNAVQCGAVTLGYLTYGTDTVVGLPPSEQWYHVNITLTGHSEVARDDGQRCATTARAGAAVLLPHRSQDIHWSSTASQFSLKIPRADLEGYVADLSRRPVRGPLDFDLHVDLLSAPGRSLLRSIEFVQSEWDDGGLLTRSQHSRRHLESVLLSSFLAAAGGPHHDLLASESTPAGSDAVRRAVTHIHEHAAELPTLTDLTAASGVSARTLQSRFLAEMSCTPMQYLRDFRLRQARAALLAPVTPEATVTDIAVEWGFFNVGRFAVLYREAYAESPSETLRKARG